MPDPLMRYDHLPSTRPRREPLRAIVLHWTAGIGAPEQVYRTLLNRKTPKAPNGLSVHYAIGVDGSVVQMADTARVCLHAGIANEWSIGIEVVSPGHPGSPTGKPRQQKAYAIWQRERALGIEREEYTDRVRGQKVRMLDYTASQIAACEQLVDQLCADLAIARRVPVAAGGGLLRRTMKQGELESFEGVMGHFHCHPEKNDCGTRPLERLRVKWAT